MTGAASRGAEERQPDLALGQALDVIAESLAAACADLNDFQAVVGDLVSAAHAQGDRRAMRDAQAIDRITQTLAKTNQALNRLRESLRTTGGSKTFVAQSVIAGVSKPRTSAPFQDDCEFF